MVSTADLTPEHTSQVPLYKARDLLLCELTRLCTASTPPQSNSLRLVVRVDDEELGLGQAAPLAWLQEQRCSRASVGPSQQYCTSCRPVSVAASHSAAQQPPQQQHAGTVSFPLVFLRTPQEAITVAGLGASHILRAQQALPVAPDGVHTAVHGVAAAAAGSTASQLNALRVPAGLPAGAKYIGGSRFDALPHPHRRGEWSEFGDAYFVLPTLEVSTTAAAVQHVTVAVNLYWDGSSSSRSSSSSSCCCACAAAPSLQAAAAHALRVVRAASWRYSTDTAHTAAALPALVRESDSPQRADWDTAVHSVLQDIESGSCSKVVLARTKQLQLSRALVPAKLLLHLASSSGFLFCIQPSADTAFLGCTPERLFRVTVDGTVSTEALAGTRKRGADAAADVALGKELLASSKDAAENDFVAEHVITVLQNCGLCDITVSQPHLARLAHVQHIRRSVEARIPPEPPAAAIIAAAVASGTNRSSSSSSSNSNSVDRDRIASSSRGPYHKRLYQQQQQQQKQQQQQQQRRCAKDTVEHSKCNGTCAVPLSTQHNGCSDSNSSDDDDHNTTSNSSSNSSSSNSSSSSSERNTVAAALLQGLHPTPAVCGSPLLTAYSTIRRHEPFDRGFYAGPVGYLSSTACDIGVGIRSALLSAGCSLTVYAGAGIVAGSTAEGEWDETGPTAKMKGLLSLFSTHSSSMLQHSLAQLPNINALWGTLAVEELFRCGVRCWALCPGSRCTPLTVAAVRRCAPAAAGDSGKAASTAIAAAAIAVSVQSDLPLVLHDERGAAFFAVGYARGSSGRPCVVVTSSGTAAANLLPGIVEANTAQLPLLVLTADRPSELRDTGANQTIDQTKMFGAHVRWYKEISCPTDAVPAHTLLSDVSTAAQYCVAKQGPVHLNMAFRENLAPDSGPIRESNGQLSAWSDKCLDTPQFARWAVSGQPLCTSDVSLQDGCDSSSSSGVMQEVIAALQGSSRGVLVVGGLHTAHERSAVKRLATLLQVSVFRDMFLRQ
jgi:isochorismate synthase EntC